MYFNNNDYLVYSSQKTATQSVVVTLLNSNYKLFHIHFISDLKLHYPELPVSKKLFMSSLEEYIKLNNKKLKLITIIRNPFDRLISSFFQTNHDDEISYKKVEPSNTIIMKNNIDDLCDMYIDSISSKNSVNYSESLYEIAEIFKFDIASSLICKGDYYYYSNDLIELYVLDFNKVNDKDYLNRSLNINIKTMWISNYTTDKIYNKKYSDFKKIIKEKEHENNLNEIIKTFYNKDDLKLFYDFI